VHRVITMHARHNARVVLMNASCANFKDWTFGAFCFCRF